LITFGQIPALLIPLQPQLNSRFFLIIPTFNSKRTGPTLVGIFGTALVSVLLLCGAGVVPIENFAPQGPMQSDLNAGGHSITNAATVSGTNVIANALAAGTPLNGTNLLASSVEPSALSFAAENSINYLGTIYSATTFSSLANFTTNGATASISAGAISLSGGSGTFTSTLDYNSYTALPKWKMTATITVGAVTGSSYGMGLGIRSYNSTTAISLTGRIDLTSNSTGGTLYINSTAGAQVAQSAAMLPFSAGDQLVLSVYRNEDMLTVSAYDLTTKSAPVTVSYQFLEAYPQTNLLPNTGRFAMFSIGGAQTVTSLTIFSEAPKNADVALVGDSKTVGYYAGNYGQSFAALLQNSFRSVTLGGASDKTSEVLLRVPEIIALAPKVVVLNIARNDVANGVAAATYEANYASIVSQLQAAGIPVYHLLPLYETVANQSTLTSWIQGTYPASNVIDSQGVNYSGTASTVLAADDIHPNAFYHGKIYEAIRSALANTNFNFSAYATAQLSQSFLTGSLPFWVGVPASASAAGTVGQIAYSPTYFYVCVGTNSWVRAPLASW
jgi:lysophospholipase L1-like esterase